MAAAQNNTTIQTKKQVAPAPWEDRAKLIIKEKYVQLNVSQVEIECLKKVFTWMDTKKDNKLDVWEVADVLVKLNHKVPRKEVELWIWEVDDDLDEHVSFEEFLKMYQRCVSDPTGLEARNLFNLVQFLMYDKDFSGRISVEQTLQILFVRHGREKLDDEIKEIFGDQQKGQNHEVKINFTEFVRRANARLTKMRWAKKEVTKVSISTRRK